MSPKHIEKNQGLFRLLILWLVIVAGIFLASFLSRRSLLENTSRPRYSNYDRLFKFHCTTIDQMRFDATAALINALQQQKEEQFRSRTFNERETEVERINGWVKMITTSIYPDLSEDYIKAIIYHESRYQPNVVNSKTGVQGLMQINPKWHTDRALRLGVTDLLDPYGNVLVGCDILNEMTKKHDFNYALNFFAGGYRYANRYKTSTSPFIEQLTRIISEMEAGQLEL